MGAGTKARQKDRLKLPERCGCSGRRGRCCSWPLASSPPLFWFDWPRHSKPRDPDLPAPAGGGATDCSDSRPQRPACRACARPAPAQCVGGGGAGASDTLSVGAQSAGVAVPVGRGGAERCEVKRARPRVCWTGPCNLGFVFGEQCPLLCVSLPDLVAFSDPSP